MAKSRSKTGNNKVARTKGAAGGWAGSALVDPRRIRYQHARIRATFSGCGRLVVDTLQAIRDGQIKPEDLPPIQVVGGPLEDGEERWYYSLNNRRLWVLKQCREEGLLTNNTIQVRVRQPKSAAEAERFTLEKCALEARFLRDPSSSKEQLKKNGKVESALVSSSSGKHKHTERLEQKLVNKDDPDENSVKEEEEESDESDSDGDIGASSNPFSALM